MDPRQEWPEPVISVQSLSESGITEVPKRYVKPLSERPNKHTQDINIPLIDLEGLCKGEENRRKIIRKVSEACTEWGFFQIVNHGVSPELMCRTREVWRSFFHLPLEEKKRYANSPKTYEGYGSRLGIQKGAILDWGDYYFFHYLPQCIRDLNKWPSLPVSCRDINLQYSEELTKLGRKLLEIISESLGLTKTCLHDAFGREDAGVCVRVNYYPKCPQPDLTLGLSSHSDPGGLTLLLPDDKVFGLQVRRGDAWVTIQPAPNSIIVNVGDQIQIMSNAIYRSLEHRVMVNSMKERISIAFFFNPKSDLLIEPSPYLVTPNTPPKYQPMTFDEYRLYIRQRGPRGKSQVDSLKVDISSNTCSS